MLTLGTGEKVDNMEERSIQLLPAHCYAVIGEFTCHIASFALTTSRRCLFKSQQTRNDDP